MRGRGSDLDKEREREREKESGREREVFRGCTIKCMYVQIPHSSGTQYVLIKTLNSVIAIIG